MAQSQTIWSRSHRTPPGLYDGKLKIISEKAVKPNFSCKTMTFSGICYVCCDIFSKSNALGFHVNHVVVHKWSIQYKTVNHLWTSRGSHKIRGCKFLLLHYKKLVCEPPRGSQKIRECKFFARQCHTQLDMHFSRKVPQTLPMKSCPCMMI